MENFLNFDLGLPRWVDGLAKRALGLRQIELIYDQSRSRQEPPLTPAQFCRKALEVLSVPFELPDDKLAELRQLQGPLIFVANHPFGAVEALVLMILLEEIRADFKLIGNSILEALPELAPALISVNILGATPNPRANVSGMRQAFRHLALGGVLGMFPAGQVSSFESWTSKKALDVHWTPHLARLIQKSEATVVPVFFEGRNSLLFQYVGLAVPELRVALLAREMLRHKKSIKFRVGDPIPHSALSSLGAPEKISAHLRARSYDLQSSLTEPVRIQAEESAEVLLAEIQSLRTHGKKILKKGYFEAFIFRRSDAPSIVEELGRLREITFRAVGEGTGKGKDLDQFDSAYLHLALWDESSQELVGSYRIGLVDELLESSGPDGLYTSTLFKWDPTFLQTHRNSLELGRSFVVEKYQKNFWSLHLLWKALGQFISENTKYRYLFGPVSISGALPTTTQSILVRFLEDNHANRVPLDRLVLAAPKNKFVPKAPEDTETNRSTMSPRSPLEVRKLIQSSVDPGFKVPPLLKHYAALGGEVLGFNVDSNFQNSIDCLFFLDLAKANPSILKRYLRKESIDQIRAVTATQMV
jgi:putative hemolysin